MRKLNSNEQPSATGGLQALRSWLWIAPMMDRRKFPAFARTASALALGLVAAGNARAAEVAVTCTNPVSGATWRIAIDYDRRTVDSYPARISETEISWRDLKDGWNYTLDRKSGKLTVVLASATGGNFLWDQCKLEN